MAATPEETARFAEDADLAEVGFGPLGRTGLTISRLGFGTYRVDDRAAPHREALTAALLAGVNLIDTASNYRDGHAEILSGQVLRELQAAGKIAREQVVVVSKGGYLQGEALEALRAAGADLSGLTEVSPGVLHGTEARFLEGQLERSLERLQLPAIDVFLLHNPEHFLAFEARREGADLPALRAEMERRLEAAFAALEEAADAGKISWYGVSSNGIAADPAAAEHLQVARLVEIARRVSEARGRGAGGHRFAVVEMPLNVLETRPALLRDDTGRTQLAAAAAAGLAVLANRPLNAFRDDRLLRLAEPPPRPDAPALPDAVDEVEAIEAVFAQDFAPRIQVQGEGAPPPDQIFQWGKELARAHERVAGLDHWLAVQTQVVAPQVNATLPRLSQAFGQDPAFEAWAARYTAALQALLAAVTARVVEDTRREVAALREKLDAVQPASWRGASLSRRAIAAVLWTPGVSSVLVGMRERAYVEDALGAVGLPPLAPEAALRALEGMSR